MELCWLINPKNNYCILMCKVKNEKTSCPKFLHAGEWTQKMNVSTDYNQSTEEVQQILSNQSLPNQRMIILLFVVLLAFPFRHKKYHNTPSSHYGTN